MKINDLHPELRTLPYRLLRSVPFHNPAAYFVISRLQAMRRKSIEPVPGIHIEDRQLRQCAVRVYRPESGAAGGGLLWIHGGGYIIGDVSINDGDCATLAGDLKLTVVSVDYRLAPKHPFPAALDDCFEAWNFLLDSAGDWAIDPDRIAVAGQSAGGGLAAAVVQRIADTEGFQPAAQVLLYPMLDDRTAADRQLDRLGHVLWNNRNNRGGWEWYLGQPPGQESVPEYAVPARREDLSGLPPTWIGVGELDLFYREDCAYAERLRAAGVPCTLHTAPLAPHSYDTMAPESSLSRAFVGDYHRFLRERLQLP